MESVQITTQRDLGSDLLYISVPGLHVVAVEPFSDTVVVQAFALVERLCQASPLDLGMLAFEDGVKAPAALVNHLASKGVMLSRLHANSALAKARLEVDRYLQLRQQGQDNLDRFTGPRSPVRRHAARAAAAR